MRERLDIWQEFLDILPKDEKIPHPLWAMEFGATYPFEKKTPFKMKVKELRNYKGSFGLQLQGKWKKEIFKRLPSHATRQDKIFPKWKIAMIKRNREFYNRNKKIIDPWLKKVMKFPSSFQKLEWNVGNEPRNINKYIIQCRGSGVRVKRPTTSPSLVAMNCTQIPIIPWEDRYMTSDECKRLQSMEKLKDLPIHRSKIYCALGNAVNVEVLKLIASSLVKYGGNKIGSRAPDD
ncbi:MAG: DNA cytosine methyltransferase [Candidatus Aenigmarchaeota archaeon]|nr:DNA cytosine methyltransferase [Candidatus Aenigmarchaeota archaeon]